MSVESNHEEPRLEAAAVQCQKQDALYSLTIEEQPAYWNKEDTVRNTSIPGRQGRPSDQVVYDLAALLREQTAVLEKILKGQERKANDLDSPIEFLNSITLIAGFLVIATFPLLTQDLSSGSGSEPTTFTAANVRVFAALSVGFFITTIMFGQILRLRLVGKRKVVKHEQLDLLEQLGLKGKMLFMTILSLLALAILFLLLIVTAYARVVGWVFAAIDGILPLAAATFGMLNHLKTLVIRVAGHERGLYWGNV